MHVNSDNCKIYKKKIQLVDLNLIYGPPCKNRTYDRPLGGARYIHLTNEGYILILYIKNNKKH